MRTVMKLTIPALKIIKTKCVQSMIYCGLKCVISGIYDKCG